MKIIFINKIKINYRVSINKNLFISYNPLIHPNPGSDNEFIF